MLACSVEHIFDKKPGMDKACRCTYLRVVTLFPQTGYCWGSVLEQEELATLTGRAPEFCVCGWALWPGSVSGALILLLSLSWARP